MEERCSEVIHYIRTTTRAVESYDFSIVKEKYMHGSQPKTIKKRKQSQYNSVDL